MNDTDLAIVVESRGIVADKHHLRSDLQFEMGIGGVGHFGKVSIDMSVEGIAPSAESLQLRAVLAVGHSIVGDQPDKAVFLVRSEFGIQPHIEQLQVGVGGMSFADMVEDGQKSLVTLAVDLSELNCHVGRALQCVGIKKERRLIVLADHSLVFGGDHRAKLV